jgi:hypothetical protein
MKNRRVDMKVEFSQLFDLEDAETFQCDWLIEGKPWDVTQVRMFDTWVQLRGYAAAPRDMPHRKVESKRREFRVCNVHDRHSNWKRLPEWLRTEHRKHVEISMALNELVQQMIHQQEVEDA